VLFFPDLFEFVSKTIRFGCANKRFNSGVQALFPNPQPLIMDALSLASISPLCGFPSFSPFIFIMFIVVLRDSLFQLFTEGMGRRGEVFRTLMIVSSI
jgi:hypothetical protein